MAYDVASRALSGCWNEMNCVVLVLCTVLLIGCAGVDGLGRGRSADSDADGVTDRLDNCLGTPATLPVKDDGCELFKGSIEGLEFGPSDHNLTSASRVALATLVQNLRLHPNVVLALGGHTDNRGAASDNLELSKRRVMAVVKYLVVNGIEGRRLKPYGYGESRPLQSNGTPEGRSVNRRIEISVVR